MLDYILYVGLHYSYNIESHNKYQITFITPNQLQFKVIIIKKQNEKAKCIILKTQTDILKAHKAINSIKQERVLATIINAYKNKLAVAQKAKISLLHTKHLQHTHLLLQPNPHPTGLLNPFLRNRLQNLIPLLKLLVL